MKKINKSIVSFFLSFILTAVTLMTVFPTTAVMAASSALLYDKQIGNGVEYTQKQQYSDSGIKQRLNIVTADLNNQNTKVIVSKAKDEVKKYDTLSQQIQREIYKGNNVVAGINADMFSMSNGFSTGPQVRDGAILTAHLWRSEEKVYPVFGITNDNKAFIDNIYLTATLTASDGSTISIDNINRENYKDSLIINTPQLNDDSKIDFSSYASNGALTVVKGITGPIKLGVTYEGNVDNLGLKSTGTVIKDNTVVIASNGSKADWIASHLKSGDKISFKFSYNRSDIKDVIGVYTYVVKNGSLLSNSQMISNGASSAHVTARDSRTGIGITADNKIIAVTVDDGTSNSQGMTYYEMGKELQSLGAVNAAVLDGGGSTQMNVRLYGNSFLNVVNTPSDGRERSITNAILFADSGQRSFAVGNIDVDKDIVIFKNTSYSFKARGTDSKFNPVDFSLIPVLWKCDNTIGKINSKGVFTSDSANAKGSVTASVGGVSGKASVKVVNSVNSLSICSSSSISIAYGSTKQFALSAADTDGAGIIINNNAAKWSVSGKIGKISASGLFTPAVKSGSGVITAQIGTKKTSVKVTVYQSIPAKDTTAPSFSGFTPSGTIYSKDTQIGITIRDNKSGVNKKSISAKLDSKAIALSYNASTGKAAYNAKNLSAGTHTFEITAADTAGNKTSLFKGTFTVNLNKDTEAPVISGITPTDNFEIKISTPRISFNVKDKQSGVNSKDISVKLDGKNLSVYYDAASGWAFALSQSPLANGIHKVVIGAKDKAGNASDNIDTDFTVNQMKGPANNDKFSFSVVTDTHATSFGNEIFNRVNNDGSELVIEDGDVVDSDSSSQWQAAASQIGIVDSKPVMTVPGNHEESGGSLADYLKYYGMSAYSFNFGNSLFVVLNSASGQSISSSDPTQFVYLQQLLAKNNKSNIFVFTHVPTKDSTGSGHQMVSGDASKLEKILGDYKKANPKKNINVVFGHLHTAQTYNVSGVIYTIAGNGCLKKYVEPQNGGFLSYTKFNINGTSVVKNVIPMMSSISIMDSARYDSGQIDMLNGAKKTLNIYGDFKLSSADYIVQLSKLKDIPINWYSDNPEIASVSSSGTITAKQTGSTVIRAAVGDKTCSIIINVILQNNIMPVSIKPSSTLIVGSKQSGRPSIIGTDIYGNSYLVDNLLVNFKVAGYLGTINSGLFTAVDTLGKDLSGVIAASINGLTVNVPVKITKAAAAKKYAVVTAKSLYMRSKPSTSGSIITTLKYGDKLEVLSDANGWLKVTLNGKTGYVLKSYTKNL